MFDLTTVDRDAIKDMVTRVKNEAPTINAGVPLLLFKARRGADGWTLGAEALSVVGEEVVLLAGSMRRGFVAFDEDTNKKLGEVSAPIFYTGPTQTADPSQLQAIPNAKVNPQYSAMVHFLDRDLTAELKGSTYGMESVMEALKFKIANRIGDDREYCNPKLRLETSSYNHRQYGLTFTPELTFLGWCNASGESKPELANDRV